MRRLLSILMIIALLCIPCGAWAEKAEKKATESTTEAASDKKDSGKPAADALSEGALYGMKQLEGAPTLSADSALLMDASSGETVYGYESDTQRYPASITKVMTALLAIEQCKLSDIVEYPSEVVNSIEPGSSTAGINAGAKITMEDTLYALMLVSANEAGAAIAHHISGSDKEFARLMTERAKELGCTGTQFRNPHGLPDEEHYTTAHDMALILRQAMRYESFRKIAGATYYKMENKTLSSPIELYNHAKIMRESSEYYYEYVEGAKTGFTQAALNTLVTYAKKDDVELICVILKDYGADKSYQDTKALYKWAFDELKALHPLAEYDLKSDPGLDSETAGQLDVIKAAYDKNYSVVVPKSFKDTSITPKFRQEQNASKGQLGFIDLMAGEKAIASVPVTYDPPETIKESDTKPVSDDDLQAVDVDAERLTPRRILYYMIRIVIAILMIFVVMRIIRGRVSRKGPESRRKGRRSSNKHNRR